MDTATRMLITIFVVSDHLLSPSVLPHHCRHHRYRWSLAVRIVVTAPTNRNTKGTTTTNDNYMTSVFCVCRTKASAVPLSRIYYYDLIRLNDNINAIAMHNVVLCTKQTT